MNNHYKMMMVVVIQRRGAYCNRKKKKLVILFFPHLSTSPPSFHLKNKFGYASRRLSTRAFMHQANIILCDDVHTHILSRQREREQVIKWESPASCNIFFLPSIKCVVVSYYNLKFKAIYIFFPADHFSAGDCYNFCEDCIFI